MSGIVAACPLEEKFWDAFCRIIQLDPELRNDSRDVEATGRKVAEIIDVAADADGMAENRIRPPRIAACTVRPPTLQEALEDPAFQCAGPVCAIGLAGDGDVNLCRLCRMQISQSFRAEFQAPRYALPPHLGAGQRGHARLTRETTRPVGLGNPSGLARFFASERRLTGMAGESRRYSDPSRPIGKDLFSEKRFSLIRERRHHQLYALRCRHGTEPLDRHEMPFACGPQTPGAARHKATVVAIRDLRFSSCQRRRSNRGADSCTVLSKSRYIHPFRRWPRSSRVSPLPMSSTRARARERL